MKNQVYIKTFGCQMNGYDSARMAELLAASHGYQAVEDPTDADLIVLNTCHIREKAEEKLFSELGRLRIQTRGRKVIIAVGGCVGQAEGERIFKRAPYVDLVFGPQNYHQLPAMLDQVRQEGGRLAQAVFPEETKFDRLPEPLVSGAMASVTVQEGCDRFCSYCVVPLTRGREWSRPVAEVVREVEARVRVGAREILLLGQNVNAYRGPDEDGVMFDLPLLLRRVALVEGVERLRFITSHPAEMSDDLVEVFADLPQLCPYLHLPIQSGSDAVLTGMARGHTVADYLAWVEKLRRLVPGVALASDFIVGFPGEGEKEFQETLDLVEEVKFDHAFSFIYSPRPGTPAAALTQDTPARAVATERLERLQTVLARHVLEKNQTRVGRVEEVLVEGEARQGGGLLTGHDPTMRVVNFPGEGGLIGTIVPVRITRALAHSLLGERLETGHG